MGPVSFTRFDCGSRTEALELARRLTEAGVRVQLVANDTAVLVRDEHATRARRIHRTLKTGRPQTGADDVEVDGV